MPLPIEKSDFEVGLVDRSLDELADMFIAITKQGELYRGLILLAARQHFKADIEFGKWRGKNFLHLTKQHANTLMNEARYFKDKPEAVVKIPMSIRYGISAPVNKAVADELTAKCMGYEGNLTGMVFRGMLHGYDLKVAVKSDAQLRVDNLNKIEKEINILDASGKRQILNHLILDIDFFYGDFRTLIPQDVKEQPDMCMKIAKVIQRYSHPDMGGTDEAAVVANAAYEKLKEDLK